MNWTAVVKELRKEAKKHGGVIATAQGQPMIQQGAAITCAVCNALADALEKGIPKIETIN